MPFLQIDPTISRGQYNKAQQAAVNNQPDHKNGNAEQKNGETGDNSANKDSSSENTFSAEQDAKLLEMKADNKSWKDIAAEIGKAQWQLKARFKEIKPADGNTANKPSDGKAKGGKKQNGDNKANQGKKVDLKNAKHSKDGEGDEAKFGIDEWMELTEDDIFSFYDLKILRDLVAQDAEWMWLRIASRFFDETGKRVDGSEIKKKFDDMGKKMSKK